MQRENESQCNRKHWACAHCPQHLGNLQRREPVLQHLRETWVWLTLFLLLTAFFFYSHGISVPSEPIDLFFFERYKLALTIKPKFCDSIQLENKDLSSMFRCLLCTKGKQSQRPFKLAGVKEHLKAKWVLQVCLSFSDWLSSFAYFPFATDTQSIWQTKGFIILLIEFARVPRPRCSQ